MTTPMRSHPFQDNHDDIRRAVLAAVDARTLVTDRLTATASALLVDDREIPLGNRKVWILSIGKAAVPMSQAVESLLDPRRVAGGVAVVPDGVVENCRAVSVVRCGHPIPTSTDGADAVEHITQAVGPDDLVVCLLSGGGSALLAAPPAGVALSDLAEMTRLLLRSGADIKAINTVRRHVSRLQGGRLLAALHPATVITFVLSDVVGGDVGSVASGPTVADPTTYAQARDVLERFGVWDRTPATIRRHLLEGDAGMRDESPKPGDARLATGRTLLLADNGTAVDAACRAAEAMGFDVHRSDRTLTGEARAEGTRVAESAIRRACGASGPWAWIGGGETVVTVRGTGLGGRNQELAAAAALVLDGRENVSLTALATDGRDGPTDAAGAVVDGETATRARGSGLDLAAALEDNDCYRALSSAGDLLHTGLTQTNVADVCWMLGDARP